MRAHMINRKMQHNFINDVVERFCSLWVLIIDDKLMFSASRVEKSRCDFSNHFNHHGSHFRTLETVIFFRVLLNFVRFGAFSGKIVRREIKSRNRCGPEFFRSRSVLGGVGGRGGPKAMFIAQILFIRALMCIIGQRTRRKSTGKLLALVRVGASAGRLCGGGA